MRTVSPELAAHLAAGATSLCTCWRLTRGDGAELFVTDHDRPLDVGGNTYRPGAAVRPSETAAALGLGTDDLEIAGALSTAGLAEDDLAAGLWDGAQVRRFLVNWAEPGQVFEQARYQLGEVRRAGGAFTAALLGPSARLSRPVGRSFSVQCDARLGDARCGVDLNDPAYSASGAVDQVIDRRRFSVTGLSLGAAGFFTHGTLVWTSGANAGLARAEILAHASDTAGVSLTLALPAAFPVNQGDTFTARAGCDKRFTTCRERFANTDNFRGFPHLPGTDWLLTLPKSGKGNTGGKR